MLLEDKRGCASLYERNEVSGVGSLDEIESTSLRAGVGVRRAEFGDEDRIGVCLRRDCRGDGDDDDDDAGGGGLGVFALVSLPSVVSPASASGPANGDK